MIKEAMFYKKMGSNRVRCSLCAHHCMLISGALGLCGVRKNIDGILNTLVYADTIAATADPIEKKPLYHFLPGSTSFSIATVGCNFKCGFCQNWQISQTSKRYSTAAKASDLNPPAVVNKAKLAGCLSISYTYTEPTVFFEYAYDTAKLAKSQGLKNIFVSNGYMCGEVLFKIRPYLDAINIDLKSMRNEFYQKNCKARLQPVLDSIKLAKKLGIWEEVTTLVIPGENDSDAELKETAEFIAGVGKEIPWHISRFHPNHNFLEYKPTALESLKKAESLGKAAGLRYVYLGNVLEDNDTYCYNCGKMVLKRNYFQVVEDNIVDGHCPFCGTTVGGVY